MATIIVSEPGGIATAYNPLEYVLTNSRTGNESEPVTNVIDNGSGFCRLSIDNSGGEWLVDDVIRGSSFTSIELNVEMLVTAIAATYIDTDIPFDVGYSTTGTVTRANNVTFHGTFGGGYFTGDFYVVARNGETTIDVRRFVQSHVSEDIPITVGFTSPSPSNSSVRFNISFVIYWTRDDGTIIHDSTPTVSSYCKAFNIALNGDESISDFIMSDTTPGKFLSRVRSGQYTDKYSLAFITEADFAAVVVRGWLGAYNTETTLPTIAIENNRGVVLMDKTIFLSFDWLEVEVWTDDPDLGGVIMSETYPLTPVTHCGRKAVEWKNKLGGFDYYEFPEVQHSSQMKATILTETPPSVAYIKNGKAVSLVLGKIDETEADFFEDLAQSRVVFFEGETAAVSNNKLKYSRNPIKNNIVLTLQPKYNN